MGYELKIFIKRNWIQLVIAWVCVVLTIKQTEIPFPFEYNQVTAFLFMQIPEGDACYDVINIFNNLGFAYWSGLIFYFIVNYFPTRKKEKKALRLVSDHVESIIMHLDCLFTEWIFFLLHKTRMSDYKMDKEFLREITRFELSIKCVFCNKIIINKKTGELEFSSQCELLNSFDSFQNDCMRILEEIEYIENHACAAQIENELVEVLSLLRENHYINNMCHLQRTLLDDEKYKMICSCNILDLRNLQKIYLYLCRMPVRQLICIIEESTEEDYEELEKDWEYMKAHYPEAVKMFESIQKQI